jgi:dihydrofolate reductase
MFYGKNKRTVQDTTPRVALITAAALNGAIGINNRLPWQLPDDWAHFRRVTAGKPFVMGRKSALAEDALLSDARNLILTRQPQPALPPGCEPVHSLDEAARLLAHEPEWFILGGAEVFAQALPIANYLYLTLVNDFFEADAFFPFQQLRWAEWELVRSARREPDARHRWAFSFNEYQRRPSRIQ